VNVEVDHRRTIIDRRALSDRLGAIPCGKSRNAEAAAVLRDALELGRRDIAKRLTDEPGNGRAAAQATAYLHDQLVRLTYDFVANRILANPPESLAIVGLGGTGRGEMAPFSDLDIMFLVAKAPTPEHERATEAVLHLLWDLKLKVGHSVRSVAQLVALAKKDLTIRTAFLEARWLWGDEKVFDGAMAFARR
jgi:[protein-PII] uridylyltransferase